MKGHQFPIDKATKDLLFSEIHRLRREHPEECLATEQLWSDHSEKANSITRDRATNTLCYTIGIMVEYGEPEEYFAMRENSEALLGSQLYQIISRLIQPYESI